jgi:hypothetical protein
MFDLVPMLERARKLASVDPSMQSATDLCESALGIEQLRGQLDAAEAHLLAELDARGTCEIEFGLRTARWLAREAMLPPGVAKARLHVGATLRTVLPDVDDALIEGRISWDHARVLVDTCNPRIAEQIAALQTELIELAHGMLFERWRRHVHNVVELLDQDGAHNPDDDLDRNRLSLSPTFGGVTHLKGMLVGEVGLTVHEAIANKADELALRFARDHERCPDIAIPARPTLQALALEELIRESLGVDIASSKPARTEVSLITHADDPTTVTTVDGVRLQDGTTRTLLCDPELYAIVVDSLGVPLDLGRHVRWATESQRRALAVRDGGCVFPGCDAPARWCDSHHRDDWIQGGRTDLGRLALLCRRHHRISHRTGWHMNVTSDAWFWWTSPTGHTFWSQRHGRQRAGPAPPAQRRT